MKRKLFSVIFLLTSISIGLGALGHGSQWPKHVRPAVAGLAPEMITLLALVWYWVSGAMLVFGLLLIWAWRRIGRGDRALNPVVWLVSAFYCAEGVWGAIYLGPFFILFVVQAVLLCGSAWVLRPPGQSAASSDPGS